ncbi:MAG: hypothetical protein GTO18_19750 [Anaerolineales bacterium]|nr:hypothetical protein [Anaerolineales bacterium]
MEDQREEQRVFRVAPKKSQRFRRPTYIVLFLALISIGALSWVASRYEGFIRTSEIVEEPPQSTPLVISPSTQSPTAQLTGTDTLQPLSASETPAPQRETPLGTLLFAAYKDGFSHLWSYVPGDAEPFQLTYGNWDDRDPSVSPDGSELVFTSRSGGNWDLHLIDLQSLELRRLTATIGYEGRPSWSPDGQWVTYEAYYEGNYDIWLLPVGSEGETIRLTTHSAVDHSPAWSPDGRKIVFVSDRDGGFDLYLADLDSISERFKNLTNSPGVDETDPSFSPDGSQLAYVSRSNGMFDLMVMSLDEEERFVRKVGQGQLPVWSSDGETIAVIQAQPYQSFIIGYSPNSMSMPPLGPSVDGKVYGLDWSEARLRQQTLISIGDDISDEPLFEKVISTPQSEEGRYSLIYLSDVAAPRSMLSDTTDEAFKALKERIIEDAGWDFLANLDYAFVGLNDPLPPGFSYNDWLYTGRAFAISDAIVRAGWVEVVREEISGETYWRVFVRTRFQDGSLGSPISDWPWDFSVRFDGTPVAYDQGGSYRKYIPPGYYIDFTSIASQYGFQRQPALPNWRTYYAGSRYTEFAFTEGLDWSEAMLEIYPASAVRTPTPFHTLTMTPTRTPRPTSTPWWLRFQSTETPTFTPSATVTPTP